MKTKRRQLTEQELKRLSSKELKKYTTWLLSRHKKKEVEEHEVYSTPTPKIKSRSDLKRMAQKKIKL